jgi:hypothetical protein
MLPNWRATSPARPRSKRVLPQPICWQLGADADGRAVNQRLLRPLPDCSDVAAQQFAAPAAPRSDSMSKSEGNMTFSTYWRNII